MYCTKEEKQNMFEACSEDMQESEYFIHAFNASFDVKGDGYVMNHSLAATMLVQECADEKLLPGLQARMIQFCRTGDDEILAGKIAMSKSTDPDWCFLASLPELHDSFLNHKDAFFWVTEQEILDISNKIKAANIDDAAHGDAADRMCEHMFRSIAGTYSNRQKIRTRRQIAAGGLPPDLAKMMEEMGVPSDLVPAMLPDEDADERIIH